MYIETDRDTRRRRGSTQSNRSVQDVLDDTKSPTDGLPPTTYTYAHTASYMPETENDTCDAPVMARRDLRDEQYSENSPNTSLPKRWLSDIRSYLTNSYSAKSDHSTHRNSLPRQQQQPAPITAPRYSRSSSRSSIHSERRNGNFHDIPPVRVTRNGHNHNERRQQIVREIDEEVEEINNHRRENINERDENFIVRWFKKLVYLPFNLPSRIWHKFSGLPWWLLIPLLLLPLFCIYAFPDSVCKPLEHYTESNIYQNCRKFRENTNNAINQLINYLQQESLLDDIMVKFENGSAFICQTIDKIRDIFNSKPPHTKEEIHAFIQEVIDQYTADEIGLADYALEANGGKIVDTKCTEYTDAPLQNVVKIFGVPIAHMSKQPNTIIKVGRMPGQCFPFRGDQGTVVIKLAVPVKPTEFVLEHLSRNISVVGHIKSAPKNFTVYALKDKNDKKGIVLGRYFYDAENGPSLQRFKPQLTNTTVVEYIEVRVTSNWGNPNYTCLYRFRVHGNPSDV